MQIQVNADVYRLGAALVESPRAVLYAAEGPAHIACLVRVLKPRMFFASDLAQMRHEIDMATRLRSVDSAVQVLGYTAQSQVPAIVYRGVSGVPLSTKSFPMGVGEFLRAANAICVALEALHAAHVVHKDIKPQHIFIDADRAWLHNFGIAAWLPLGQHLPPSGQVIEGTLAYIAPEQTGRLNRFVDYRSDLYSLGVTFFQMLTGELPLTGGDVLSWLHAHIACVPPSLDQVRPDIPKPLARIVGKLLAKVGEDRYQTARGLRLDLGRCADWVAASSPEAAFVLGVDDESSTLHLSQNLYGRAQQVAQMHATFASVVNGAAPRLLILSGPSGMGKSTLVHELYRPIVREKAFFASGKFAQFQQHQPFSALLDAVADLCLQINALPQPALRTWRQALQKAVGANGAVLTQLLPDLERLIGEQLPVKVLGARAAHNRLALVFEDFLRAFCRPSAPMVLFLDDMQWADGATLALLRGIFGPRGPQYLMFVMSYRDDEVDAAHPLQQWMTALAREGAALGHVAVTPLNHEDVHQLLRDSLHQDGPQLLALAQCIVEKTQGNPFFVGEFIKTLYSKELLKFSTQDGAWNFDPEAIAAEDLTDNVLDLMVQHLQTFARETQVALSAAACLGGTFSLADLAPALSATQDAATRLLQPALDACLVLRLDGGSQQVPLQRFAFRHDRIQQAAYSLLDDAHRRAIHLEIGRRLAACMPPATVFVVANHLNAAGDLLQSASDRQFLFELNVQAGRAAQQSAAFAVAYQYFCAAQRVLPAAAWQTAPEATLALHRDLIEAGYLGGQAAAAEAQLEATLVQVQAPRDRADLHVVQIRMYQGTGRFHAAAETCLRVLTTLGVDLDTAPEACAGAIQAARDEIIAICRGKSPQDFVQAPDLTDPDAAAQLKILQAGAAPLYIVRPDILPLALLAMARLTFSYGRSPIGAYGLSVYGLLLAGHFGEIAEGYAFAKAAIDLNAALDDAQFRGAILHIFGVHVSFWKDHYDISTPLLQSAFNDCGKVGDLEYGNYIGFQLSFNLWEKGDALHGLSAATAPYLAFAKRSGAAHIAATIAFEHIALRYLQDEETEAPHVHQEAQKHLQTLQDSLFKAGEGYCTVMGLGVSHILGDDACALQWLERFLARSDVLLSTPAQLSGWFYAALSLARNYPNLQAAEQAGALRQIEAIEARFAGWAADYPANAAARAALIHAEVARLQGRVSAALQYFEEARLAAIAGKFIQIEALANEMAAGLYTTLHIDKVALMHIHEAHRIYLQWGALHKVSRMQSRYPELRGEAELFDVSTVAVSVRQVGLLSILKASQNISSEMLLPNLLATMMRIVLEYTGAQRSVLVLAEEGTLQVVATGDANAKGDPKAMQPRALADHDTDLAAHVVRFVWRTGETVYIADAQKHHAFKDDRYLAQQGVRSILCYPIVRKNQVSGMFYLENNLLADAFKTEQMFALDLLAAQIAISIDNSRLYKRSQQAIAARDTFLSIASHELKTPLTPLKLQVQSLFRYLQKGKLDHEKMRIWAERAERQIDRLNRLVNDLLDVSHIDQGAFRVEREAVDLAGIVNDVLAWCQDDLARAGCRLTSHITSVRGAFDGPKIEQVVSNLVLNAAKYAAGAAVRVTLAQRLGRVHLQVADDGPGIAAVHQASIFERYARGGAVASAAGLGLGLFIAKQIVTAHGGQLTVSSSEGEGATFTMDLPLSA